MGLFFQTLEVRSILQIMGAILHPYDDLKVVEALSSVFFGFSYDDLALLKKINKSFDYRSVDIRKLPHNISEQIETLQTLNRTSAQYSPSDFVENIIESLHAFQNIQSRFNGEQAEQNIRKLIWIARDYETSRNGNILEFQSWIADVSRRSDEISEARVPTQPNSVQIMTIHQSKGLEFPVVFVANLSSEIRNYKNARLPIDSSRH